MSGYPADARVNCERFLNELEGLPAEGAGGATAEELLAKMPVAAREHVLRCTGCSEALQDFAETRQALEGMKAGLPEAGPWFTARVMGAIRAKEAEIEEKKEGVWVGVRRLAPRLVAFAAVLLALGGSWAIEVRRADRARRPELRPGESLFEAAPKIQVNDDIVASAYQEQLP